MIDVMMIFIRETSKRKSNGNKVGLFYCVCGKWKETDICLVKNGKIKSCGCTRSISLKNSPNNNKTHGMTNTPEYRVWMHIKDRCYNKKSKDYSVYGARGITVCGRWLESFENFYEDMAKRPSKDHSIHRKDNGSDYKPDNCIWATDDIQSRHKRNNINITYNNKTQTLKDWSIELGIDYKVLHNRYHKLKYSIEECFKPVIPRENIIEYNGKKQNILEWAKELNLSYSALKNRLKSGMSVEKALSIKPHKKWAKNES